MSDVPFRAFLLLLANVGLARGQYAVEQVTTGSVNHRAPGINTSGEIVWMQETGQGWQVFSSTRGQLTSPKGNYTEAQYPVLADDGSFVCFRPGSLPCIGSGYLLRYPGESTVEFCSENGASHRDPIPQSGISSDGTVIWGRKFYDSSGNLSTVRFFANGTQVSPGTIVNWNNPSLNRNGEYVYDDGTQIFSSTRGALVAGIQPTINDAGNVAFATGSEVRVLHTTGTVGIVGAGGDPGINSQGTVVFERAVGGNYQIFRATPACPARVTAAQLRSYLVWHAAQGASDPNRLPLDPVLSDLGNLQALIDESFIGGWDPRFILGIAGAESTFGTDALYNADGRSHNNYWGIGCPSCLHFNSVQDAVQYLVNDLNSANYNGYVQIDQIAPIYTATAVDDWKSAVRATLRRLGYPNADDVSCSAGSQHPFVSPSTSINVESPISIYLVDPIGRRLGHTCEGQFFYREIPGAVAEQVGGDLRALWLPSLSDGHYTIVLCGTGAGGYQLASSFIDSSGTFSGSVTNGQISAGDVIAFVAQVSTTNAAATAISPLPAYVHVQVDYLGQGALRLVWSGVPAGRVNSIEYSPSFVPAAWTNVSGPVVGNVWTNASVFAKSQGFFRVRVD